MLDQGLADPVLRASRWPAPEPRSRRPSSGWMPRAHDANLIQKAETYLKDHDTTGLDIRIMAPGRVRACVEIKFQAPHAIDAMMFP